MDNFIDEVEEELRSDRQKALWKRYGGWVIAAALVLVIAVAAAVGWRHYQENRRIEAGLELAAAIDLAEADRTEAALERLAELAENAPGGFAALARLEQAALEARSGDAAEAAALYDALSRDSSAPRPFRDLSLILYGLTMADTADPQVLKERLAGLEDTPWRFSALEITALLERRRGDNEAARGIYATLNEDPQTPPGIRARAGAFLDILAGQGGT